MISLTAYLMVFILVIAALGCFILGLVVIFLELILELKNCWYKLTKK